MVAGRGGEFWFGPWEFLGLWEDLRLAVCWGFPVFARFFVASEKDGNTTGDCAVGVLSQSQAKLLLLCEGIPTGRRQKYWHTTSLVFQAPLMVKVRCESTLLCCFGGVMVVSEVSYRESDFLAEAGVLLGYILKFW